MQRTYLKNAARNSLTYFVSISVGIATGFVIMPALVHGIGLVEFGIWAVATTVVGYSGVLDLGLGQTLIRKASDSMARGDTSALRRTTCEVFSLYLLLGGVVLLVGGLIATYGGLLFDVADAKLGTFRHVVLILFITAAFSFPMSVLNGLIGALQDFHFIHLFSSFLSVIRAISTLALVAAGFGLVPIVLATSAVAILGWLGNYLWVRHHLPELQVRPLPITREFLDVARFSGSMFVWALAGQALQSLDRIIVGLLMPLAAVGSYEIGARLHSYTKTVANVAFVALPTASALDAEGRRRELTALYRHGSKLIFGVYGAVTLLFLLFAGEFVHLWMGPGFEQSVLIAQILTAATLFQSQNSLGHIMLVGTGTLRTFTIVMACYPFLLAAFGALSGFAFGVVGVAWGVLAAILLAEGVLLRHLHSVMGVTAREWLMQIYIPVGACLALAGLAGVVTVTFLQRGTWGLLGAKAALLLISYMALFFVVALRPSDREALLARLNAKFASARTP